ncbi:MAG: hypothetical protein Q9217_004302 [Psora testacea]
MDPPKTSTLRASGIPRASKLPVPNNSVKSPGSSVSSPYTVPKRDGAVQLTNNIAAQSAQVVAETDGRLEESTLHSSSTSRAQCEVRSRNGSINYPPLKATLQSIRRRPRPTLSDRTAETLSQIPPSPSPSRRKSSFFTSQSPMTSPARPASSLSRNRSSTSAGHHPPLPTGFPTSRPTSPTKRHLAPTTGNKTPPKMPSQRSVSSFVPRSLPPSQSNLKGTLDDTPSKIRASIPSLTAQQEGGGHVKTRSTLDARGSRTLAARLSKPRVPAKNVFVKPDRQVAGESVHDVKEVFRPVNKKPPYTKMPEDTSTRSDLASLPAERPTPPKSSAALRETIAKAKAARRAASNTHKRGLIGADAAMDDSPEIDIGGSNKGLLRQRIANARSDGRLNIAAMALSELPSEVLRMYDASAYDNDGSWAESVDLVRLVAADNEITSLGDHFFPHDGPGALDDVEHANPGSIFGGLETLDLHGNVLRTIPPGLAVLKRLTTLNISKNRLENDTLQIISEIKSLRELRIAENDIKGSINPNLYDLANLEVLELSKNEITNLPPEIAKLSALRTLLISGNRLRRLPVEALAHTSIRELDASRNNLMGCLFPTQTDTPATLKSIDVSYNALTSLSENDTLDLPAIQTLNMSENRIKTLPNVSLWTSLTTVTADGNQMTTIPISMTNLPVLRNVDFARNNIRQLDERIGLMDNLSVLRIANNPLKERRLLNMNTEDLKRELRSRLDELDDGNHSHHPDEDAVEVRSRVEPTAETWHVQTGGFVDRSSRNIEAIEASDIEPLIEKHIKTLMLHHNALATIPQAIGLTGDTLTTLDLSHNKLSGESYLVTALSLPKLKALNLSANGLSSLSTLLEFVSAPALTELNISRNRLSTLPILRSVFPALNSVFAGDNSITNLPVDSVRGLHVLDVGSNEIAFLEPKLGLLSQDGLRTFLVGANRFRVPRRDVVEKGTEAILAWLRGKIPDEEM